MSENSNGNEVIYWFNSNNGDFIMKKSPNEFRLIYRVESRPLPVPQYRSVDTLARILTESEFNFIRTKFGFLPIKSKRFKSSLERLQANNYNYVIYPDKDEIRNIIISQILK
jgi:hypothetical protein